MKIIHRHYIVNFFFSLLFSGSVLSTVDMVAQRRDGPRWLRELDDDADDVLVVISCLVFLLLRK